MAAYLNRLYSRGAHIKFSSIFLRVLQRHAPCLSKFILISPMRMLYELIYMVRVRQVAKGNILELGCGHGMYCAMFNSRDYVGIDIDDTAFPDSDYKFEKMDATAMRFTDESFDTVLAMSILEHVPDDCALLREAYRVLRPGGKLIIATPAPAGFIYESRSIHKGYGQSTFHAYSRRKLVRMLGRAGFRTDEAFSFLGVLSHCYIVARTLCRLVGLATPAYEQAWLEKVFLAEMFLGNANFLKINTFAIATKSGRKFK